MVVKGDKYGVEVELELSDSYEGDCHDSDVWRFEGDGSLRMNGVEFVMREPLAVDHAIQASKELLEAVGAEYKVLDTGRAGVHVHVNVSDLTDQQLVSFIAIAHSLDHILTHFCGERREGNLFCLRMTEANYVIDKMQEFARTREKDVFRDDNIRYASVNLKAISTYGSVEFRAFRSDGDPEALAMWIGMLDRLKKICKDVTPVQIVHQASEFGPREFVKALLGEYFDVIGLPYDYEAKLYESIRQVQDYAYEGWQ